MPSVDFVFLWGDKVDMPFVVGTVLGSRAVVAAIRLAVIFAGIYVVVSVGALMARRQWLIKVGPLEVSERVSEMREIYGGLKDCLRGPTRR